MYWKDYWKKLQFLFGNFLNLNLVDAKVLMFLQSRMGSNSLKNQSCRHCTKAFTTARGVAVEEEKNI